MDKDLINIVEGFNLITIKDYATKHGEDFHKYSEDDCQRIVEIHYGPISSGAIYKWPRYSGGHSHVMGLGLRELNGELWFLAGRNSKKERATKVEKLEAATVLKMIEWGEVEYLGSIFDMEFRKTYDMERLTLSIIGLASMAYSHNMQKNISVDEIINKIESGEMSMNDLLEKCKTSKMQDLIL
jgi:hypothetical protein